MTFGLKRVEILSAQANGITLLVLGAIIAIEGDPPPLRPARRRRRASSSSSPSPASSSTSPPPRSSPAPTARASTSRAASSTSSPTSSPSSAPRSPPRSILLTGFDQADAIASLLVAGLMLRSASGLLRDSGRIFLEASPKGIDPDRIGKLMAAQPGVVEVHDLHVWEVTSEFPALVRSRHRRGRRRLPPHEARARRPDRAPVRHPPHDAPGRARTQAPRADRRS